MPKIQRLANPSSQWEWNPQENFLGNPSFGRIQVVEVCSDDGNVIFEQPIFLQQLGEFYVVVNKNGHIAFIQVQRHAVIPIEKYHSNWHTWRPPQGSTEMLIPHPADIHEEGVTLLELPRGLALNKLQEAEEETGYRVTQVAHLGHLNPDASFYGTSPAVYVCEASEILSDIPPDPHENILQVLWLAPERAKNVQTLSMHTYASLFLFRRWALTQTDEFWRTIGEKL